jgi:predicted transcriptional regulator
MSSDFTQSTAKIVSAFARNNGLAPADLPSLIGTVNTALAGASEPEPAPKAVAVVSARASVKPDSIACMTCGKKFKSLKRHLRGEHGQTPQQYREQWGLAGSYPMVAATYSAARSALAKSIGLGGKGRRPKAEPVALKATAPKPKMAGPAAKAKVVKPHPKPSGRKKVAG